MEIDHARIQGLENEDSVVLGDSGENMMSIRKANEIGRQYNVARSNRVLDTMLMLPHFLLDGEVKEVEIGLNASASYKPARGRKRNVFEAQTRKTFRFRYKIIKVQT
ncbi:unnamed protein product [Dovyalis caffra]|uniref:Uncharacterized protein n=1 Tax=Dovyalis caffra TaxID=77055 RepID=A0AAV1S126_9ROSI|nr:unnamed protein product [Dovyalis caffra]